MEIIEEICNKYDGAKEFNRIIELKNYVFKIEYFLVRYVYGLKLTYFDIKSNFLLKVS